MGNYNRMNTLERRVLREVFPFYSWMRQSTLVAFRLPFNSPMRAAMIYSIGTALMDPDMTDEMRQMVGSRFDLGGRGGTFLDIGSFSPNAEMTDQGITAFDPRNIGGSLSLGLKFPFQFLTGTDPNTWGQGTRPTDMYDRGLWGGKEPTPPWTRLQHGDLSGFAKEMAWMLRNTTPQARGIYEMIAGPEARYGGTGYPVDGIRNENITWNRSLLRTLQLPNLYDIDFEEVQKEARKREKQGK
jgi:hypothetical protein